MQYNSTAISNRETNTLFRIIINKHYYFVVSNIVYTFTPYKQITQTK